ncbi:MAG: hypothetical protein ABIQ98_07505 [Sphingomicrobium sp.]
MSDDARTIDDNRRARRLAASGWLIIALSAGAAILPFVDPGNGALVIGGMLIAAGLIEVMAATVRHQTRMLALLAGAVTILAGLLFATDNATHFLSTLTIIMGWLFARSLILAASALLESGSARRWTALSAATDFLLSAALAIGLSISALIVTLFGATGDLVTSFAWVLAISFIATGTLLLELASIARREDV